MSAPTPVTQGGAGAVSPTSLLSPPIPTVVLDPMRQTERDAGAETEVEADGRGRSPRPEMLMDLTETVGGDPGASGGEDEDMVDLTHAHAEMQMRTLSDGGDLLADVGRVQLAEGAVARGDYSDGEGGGNGSSADVDELGGMAMDGEVDADGTVNGKRKR